MVISDDKLWLDNIVSQKKGYEFEAVERYSDRLLRLAHSRLPKNIRTRMDPADIVQSALRSFFSRNEAGKFQFDESEDIWRLLAAITFRKVKISIRFHSSQQRDVTREIKNDETRWLLNCNLRLLHPW